MHTTFDKFLAALRTDLEALEARTKAEAAAASPPTPNGSGTLTVPPGFIDSGNGTQSQNSSFNSQLSDDKPAKSSELAERRAEYGLVYIVHMRFARRAEGVKSSRAVFGKARRDRWAPWEVYEAAGAVLLCYR